MIRGFGLLILLLCIVSCSHKPVALETSFWYWHTPFQLFPKDVSQLQSMGVKRLFVRAGTFTHSPEGVQLGIAQQWTGPKAAFPVVLVYNFDSGLLSHFGTLNLNDTSRTMIKAIEGSSQSAAAGGVQVEGVQLDIDSPTRLLPRYASLLHMVHAGLDRSWTFSATALSSWLTSKHVNEIAKEVDYLAPQFYESQVALTDDKPTTIADLNALEEGLGKAASLPVPFYAGVAGYGHSLLYNERGQLAAVYRSLSPEDALRHTSFAFRSNAPLDKAGSVATAQNYIGEDKLTLQAVRPGRGGKGLGYRLVFDLPNTRVLDREARIVQERAPNNCRGMIIYRLPQEDDSFALSLSSAAAALRHQPEALAISADVKSRENPWRTVELTNQPRIRELRLSLVNDGNVSSLAAPGSVTATVHLDKPGIEGASPGDFDNVEFGRLENGRFTHCMPGDADTLLLQRGRILAGQTLHSGAIQVVAHGPCQVSWRVVGPGGFETVSGGVVK